LIYEILSMELIIYSKGLQNSAVHEIEQVNINERYTAFHQSGNPSALQEPINNAVVWLYYI